MTKEQSKAKSSIPATQSTPDKAPPQNFAEALEAVLLDVPKAAQKTVRDATEYVAKSIRAHARNFLTMGTLCSEVRAGISKAAFSRWISEVLPRVGASSASIYRWMGEAETLKVSVPDENAREALVAVTGGRNLFSREDGQFTLTGAFTSALRLHPVPKGATYEACLDWSRNVLVKIEQGTKGQRSVSELYKAGLNLFGRILKKNVRLAAEFVVACYRLANNVSPAIGDAITEGIDSPSMTLDAVGKLATNPAVGEKKVA